MSLEELVADYGYTAITIGTFLEGETILVLGGFAAHRGFLELPWVIVCAFLGSFAGDQTFFYVGRMNGEKILEKRPKWKAKSARVLNLFNQHQTWLILGFRFLYGVRSVTPFLLGAAKVSPLKFFFLNMIGAAVWAAAVGCLGYSFGYAVEAVLGDIKHYEMDLFGVMAAVGLSFWLFRLLTKKRTR
jgi:membrane protein DedA with SNARE-associated domain